MYTGKHPSPNASCLSCFALCFIALQIVNPSTHAIPINWCIFGPSCTDFIPLEFMFVFWEGGLEPMVYRLSSIGYLIFHCSNTMQYQKQKALFTNAFLDLTLCAQT